MRSLPSGLREDRGSLSPDANRRSGWEYAVMALAAALLLQAAFLCDNPSKVLVALAIDAWVLIRSALGIRRQPRSRLWMAYLITALLSTPVIMLIAWVADRY
jgi:hypothetical protein